MFTEGEWKVEKRILTGGYEFRWRVISETKPPNLPSNKVALVDTEANAHLIAAAPEMYEALKETLDFFHNEMADTFITQGILLKFPSLPKIIKALAKA